MGNEKIVPYQKEIIICSFRSGMIQYKIRYYIYKIRYYIYNIEYKEYYVSEEELS